MSLNSQLTQQQRKDYTIKNGSRKKTHSFGFIVHTMFAIILADVLPLAVSFGQNNCLPPPYGMVAWWPLDDETTSPANDLAGYNNQMQAGKFQETHKPILLK